MMLTTVTMVTVLLFIDIQRCRSGLKLLGSGRTCDGVRNQMIIIIICFFTTKFHISLDSYHCPIFLWRAQYLLGRLNFFSEFWIDLLVLWYEDILTIFTLMISLLSIIVFLTVILILLKVLHFSNNCKKLSFGTKDITQCWENYVGFAFYRLIMVDFAFLLVSTFFGEFVRRCELLLILYYLIVVTILFELTLS